MNEYCVVKVNHDEQYVAVICGGSKQECEVKLAYFQGLEEGYKSTANKTAESFPRIEYKIMSHKDYDPMMEIEACGGMEVYQQMFNQ